MNFRILNFGCFFYDALSIMYYTAYECSEDNDHYLKKLLKNKKLDILLKKRIF